MKINQNYDKVFEAGLTRVKQLLELGIDENEIYNTLVLNNVKTPGRRTSINFLSYTGRTKRTKDEFESYNTDVLLFVSNKINSQEEFVTHFNLFKDKVILLIKQIVVDEEMQELKNEFET